MLENVPRGIGKALRRMRSGAAELMINDAAIHHVTEIIEVTSLAFEGGKCLPSKYTADGEGLSPPLSWRGVPPGSQSVVLIVEDADSPTPNPLVHAIAWDLPGEDGGLGEEALRSPATEQSGAKMGRNSYFAAKYLPPDPPVGHGPHRYAFQVFALNARPDFGTNPGRGKLLAALKEHAIAKGLLVGIYERK
jgi:Raf kinase inhibitor-like YbhB/YbcL family protein